MITESIDRASESLQTGQEVLDRARTAVDTGKRFAYGAGGAFLLVAGLRRRGLTGAALALAGSDLLYHGMRGEGHLVSLPGPANGELPYGRGVKIKESVIVDKPAPELYRFWRDFENLPSFMHHLESVEVEDETKSHWTVKAPAGTNVEWDAEVIADREDELIGWRSVEGAAVDHAGSVRFEPDNKGERTRVTVKLQYNPVAGKVGAGFARVFGPNPRKQVRQELLRFKRFAESVDLNVIDRLLHKRSAA